MDHPIAQRVLVVGGGIAGPVAALLLKQKGWQPIVLEKVKGVGASGLALVVQSNGMKVLNKAGVVDVVLDGTLPWKMWNDWSSSGDFLGGVGSNTPGDYVERYGWPAVGISRTHLQLGLKRAVEDQGIPFIENWKLKDIRVNQDTVVAISEDGKEIEASYLVGCDGLKSITRQIIFARHGVADVDPTYTGIVVAGGNSPTPPFLQQRQGVNIFWGPDGAIVTHPIEDGRHLWGATLPVDENIPESWYTIPVNEMESKKQEYLDIWKDWPPVIHELVRTATKMQNFGLFERGVLGKEHWYDERMLLIGDAAHPTTPHIGQGANQCLEDAWALFEAIPVFDTSRPVSTAELMTAFRSVVEKREPPTTAVMLEALKQGENRVLRGDRATAEGQKCRDDMLIQRWNDIAALRKEQDALLSAPFDDRGGYNKWLEAKGESTSA